VSDDPEVLEAFEALFTALLGDRDASAGSALFVQEDDITMWGSELGERAVGPEELAELHEAIAASESVLEFHWDELRTHVHDDVAWVNAAGEIAVDGRGRPYRLTAVLVQRNDGWRWHTFNGSEPR
jgi:hypothetical protein